ncbi:hypothetical protein GCM10010430_21770 [Kitasatospora cystarginea]|uniref:Transposase n=1 Tax=Kitasatospora cystarginea TaxID=58350 RepID=A0ABP5QQT6_9ACTN
MGRPSKYSDEFRRDAVALHRASGGRRTFEAVAKEIGVNHETLRNWVRAAGAGSAGPEPALDSDERAELARLRKAEREWQVEKEILRRAAAPRNRRRHGRRTRTADGTRRTSPGPGRRSASRSTNEKPCHPG